MIGMNDRKKEREYKIAVVYVLRMEKSGCLFI